MNTGLCKLKLHLPENQSLKEKRRVLKSITSRLRNQFNISIAEVGDYDLWQSTCIGISCVSNNNQHVDEVLNKIMNYIAQNYPELEIVDHDMEIIHGP
jgi:uncharacterized protein YlxP (DUF503 family)